MSVSMKKDFFFQPVKNDLITYDNTKKIMMGQGNDYTTGCLLDYLKALFKRKLYVNCNKFE